MKNCEEFIESGILELYVLGETTTEENGVVKFMSEKYPVVREEILAISWAIEKYALEHAITPDPIIKPFMLAVIDFTERMKAGEQVTAPPVLTENAAIADYEPWIGREDMFPPEYIEDIYAKILSYTPELMTAIVWIKTMAPQEVHHDQHEKFLILEGTCTITVENEVYDFKSGDYFAIPLHKDHYVTVTSAIPCKVILQRLAA